MAYGSIPSLVAKGTKTKYDMKSFLVWVKEHNTHLYVLFFIIATYILRAYEPQLKGVYDDNIMPILEEFIPSAWSCIAMISVFSLCLFRMWQRLKKGYQYSCNVASIVAITLVLIIRYRFSGEYCYYPWFGFITYVDALWMLLFSYMLAFVYSRYIKYKEELKKKSIKANEPDDVILQDWPISEESEDVMNLGEEAKDLAGRIKSLDKRKTWSLAITAPWGTGKTSFLNLVVNKIDRDTFDIVYFNPRDSKSYQSIQTDFFNTLACTLSEYDSRCNGIMKNYMASLQLIDNRGVVEKILNFYKIWDKESIKDDIKASFVTLKKSIIVLIDDFDRLSKDEILEVLKLIDSNAAFNNLVFLTAYDKIQVNKSLGDQFQTDDACFVDKFFNLEFSVPARPYRYIAQFIEKEMCRILKANDSEKHEITNALERYRDNFQIYLPTLRDAKRFINQIVVDYTRVRGEVNLHEYMLLHLIKYKYPERFKEIHRFEYIERGSVFSNDSILYLKEGVDEKLDIFPVLSRLFPRKERINGSHYRHIYEASSFEFYFANQVFDSLKMTDMVKMFYGKFEDACQLIDQWITDEKKVVDLIEYLDSYDMDNFANGYFFDRYAKLLAYLASKNPNSRVYWLFLRVIYIKNTEGYDKKYQLKEDEYKKGLLQIITDSSNGPEYPLLQKLHLAYKTVDINEEEELIKDVDFWEYVKTGFLEKLKSDSVCEATMGLLYKCIDHMEASSKIILDGDCAKAMKEEILKNPLPYLKDFVRLGGVSSRPDFNSIACEPFWEQIFGSKEEFERFIAKCESDEVDGIALVRNFWLLYQANNMHAIEFSGQGNVQEKINKGLNDECKLLSKLREIESCVAAIPEKKEGLSKEEKEKYRIQLETNEKELDRVNLYISLNGNIRNEIERRKRILS